MDYSALAPHLWVTCVDKRGLVTFFGKSTQSHTPETHKATKAREGYVLLESSPKRHGNSPFWTGTPGFDTQHTQNTPPALVPTASGSGL